MEDKKTRSSAIRAGALLEGSLETFKLGCRAVKSGDHGRPKYKIPAWSLPNYRRLIKFSLRYYFGKISLLLRLKSGKGHLTADYVHGSRIDEVLTMTRSGQTYYYHMDGLGSSHRDNQFLVGQPSRIIPTTSTASPQSKFHPLAIVIDLLAGIRRRNGPLPLPQPHLFACHRPIPAKRSHRLLCHDESCLLMYSIILINWVDPLGLEAEHEKNPYAFK